MKDSTVTVQDREAAAVSPINPRLIECFFEDLSQSDLDLVASALARVPGDEEGRRDVLEKFQKHQAVMLATRNAAGHLASFAFYEVRVTPPSSAREFFIEAGFALQHSRNLVETSFPQFEQWAVARGCQSITFQTARAGLVNKVLKMSGWELQPELVDREWLLRKRL